MLVLVLGDVVFPAMAMDGFGRARGGDAGGRPGWDGDNRLALGDLVTLSGLPALRDLGSGSGDGTGDGAGDDAFLLFLAASTSFSS